MPEKILVVDDDIDTLRLVGLMLERRGYEIVAASNGRQAITMAQSEQPDLVLLDIMMPDIDGYEVTRQLRDDPSIQHIPVIMFTAKSQVEDKLLGFEVGADDYLTKPTQPRELFAHIKAVLARSAKVRDVAPARERGFVVGIMATRGGLGVTTLTLNLGIAIHKQSKQDVIVAEFRPGQGSLSLELGYLKPEGLNRLLNRKPAEISLRNVETELIGHHSGVRLLLSSPQPCDAQYITAVSNFEAIAHYLPQLARYVLIDLGTAITPVNQKVIPCCNEIIIVVEPSPHNVFQTKTMIQDLATMGTGEGRIKPVLVNRVRSGMQLSLNQVQEKLEHNITTVFTPAPELAYQAANNNIPLLLQQPDSLTAEQYNKLASLVADWSQ